MRLAGTSAVVTGGASGLGRASAEALAAGGAKVVIVDRVEVQDPDFVFVPADVRDPEALAAAFAAAQELAPLRTLVHCAGRGGPVRLVDRDGNPGSLDVFNEVVTTNLMGTFNALRLGAAAMAANDPVDGERGVCVLTASVAAFEGQIGQIPYAASKAGVVGMTVVAARDLARRLIRVCTIAPGVFDTPILGRLSDDVRAGLAAAVPHPARLGQPEEFAALAMHIVANPMLNGETIRLDGAIRMPPR